MASSSLTRRSTTVNNWRQRLLLAFDAGDANFYRYVGNNPTNATDLNGTQTAVTASTHPSTLTEGLTKLRNDKTKRVVFGDVYPGTELKSAGGTFDCQLGGAKVEGKVQIFLESKFRFLVYKAGSDVNPDNYDITPLVQFKFTAGGASVKNCHWIQFVKATAFGNEVPKSYEVRDPSPDEEGRKFTLKDHEYGKWYIDGGPKQAYYDHLGLQERTNTSLSIFDYPKGLPRGRALVNKEVLQFYTYLICEGKVTYCVEWKFIEEYQKAKVGYDFVMGPDKESFKGYSTDKFAAELPEWVLTKTWVTGQTKDGKDVTVENPISGENLKKAKK